MQKFLISMALSVLFAVLQEKNVPEEYRAALAKLFNTIQTRAKTDNKLAQMITPKPNS